MGIRIINKFEFISSTLILRVLFLSHLTEKNLILPCLGLAEIVFPHSIFPIFTGLEDIHLCFSFPLQVLTYPFKLIKYKSG